MALLAALAGTALLLTAGFPPGAPDRLPVLVVSVALALAAAISPARGIALFAFLFPCAGLLALLAGGHDPVTWPGVMLGGLVSGWCFRFLYDFESPPQRSPSDRILRALLAVWTLSTVLASARAVTLWAAVRRLFGRAVNSEGLPDSIALRETLFAFAALAGGAVLYFLLRRSGEAARRSALGAALAGVAVSAAAAVLQRAGVLPPEARPYWKLTARVGGGAVDPNSLGLLCALLLGVALARALLPRPGRGRTVAIASLVLLGSGLVLSGSRSAVLMAGLEVVLLLGARVFPFRVRLAAVGGAVLIAAVVIAASWPAGRGSAGVRIAQTFDPALPLEFRVSARPVLWRAAIRLFLRNPVVGAGMGAFTWRFPDLLAEENRSLGIRDNPGSGYVQALAETGGIGFAVTLAAALSLAAQGWRRARDAAADPSEAAAGLAVIAFLAALVVGSHWLAPDAALLFFLLAASSAPPEAAAHTRATVDPRGRLWAATALLYAVASAIAIFETAVPEETFRYAPGIGFHDREVGPGGPFRWTRRRFALWIRPGERVRLGLANFGPLGQPVGIDARSGGVSVFRRTLSPGDATAVVLSGGRVGAPVVFVLDKSFVPHRLSGSADRRDLGLLSTSSRER